jgi:DNA-binding NarL/FixJ family response regulator
MTPRIRIMIVDDHAVVRAGVEQLLDAAAPNAEVVALARSGEEAVRLVGEAEPDIVLMDLSMPGMGGTEATRIIAARHPRVGVVILTSFADRARILGALEAGAVGYLLKDAEPAELVAAVEAAARGESPLAPTAISELVQAVRAPSADGLSERELEVLALIAEGRPNKTIAAGLGITERTVKAHLTRIYRSIGVDDRTQAALWARRRGIGGDFAVPGS